MRRYFGCCLAYSLVVVTLGAAADVKQAPKAAKPALETWETAYLGDARAGYVHTLVKTLERDGATVYHATTDLSLTVKRFDNVIQLQMITGSEEDADGKVLAVWMRQMLGKGFLILKGTVDGKVLNVTVDEERNGETNRRLEKKVPWNDQVVGLYRQKLLFEAKKVKPEDQFSYLSYEPTINSVIKTTVTVGDYEEVEVRGKKKSLLRVQAAMDKIKVGETTVNLPAMTAWLDKDYSPERSVMEVPGLGNLTLYRGTKEQATGGGTASPRCRTSAYRSSSASNKKILRPTTSRTPSTRSPSRGMMTPPARSRRTIGRR